VDRCGSPAPAAASLRAIDALLRSGAQRSWTTSAATGDGALDSVQAALDTVDLIDLTRGDLLSAGAHVPLRSNDAIHLAVALRVGTDVIVTYDAGLSDAAHSAGLAVLAPDPGFS
jgi:predicted nucleic acid-binding protein